MSASWKGHQDAVARPLWQAGVRAAEIGGRVGRTRMAVIGRADRMGWGKHPKGPDLGSKWTRRIAERETFTTGAST